MNTAETLPLRFSLVENERPDPPYAKETRIQHDPVVGWSRIRASKTWRLCPPEHRNSLLRLWLESWNEVPTGSWEADDSVIAAAIDMPVRVFRANREHLLRGWYAASDGRLYHPFIVETVLALLEKRRGVAARVKKHRESRKRGPDLALTLAASSAPQALEEPKKARKATPATKIPADWQPNSDSLKWLASHGITEKADQDRLINDFRTYWIQTGTKKANWDLAFIRNPVVKGGITRILNARSGRPSGFSPAPAPKPSAAKKIFIEDML